MVGELEKVVTELERTTRGGDSIHKRRTADKLDGRKFAPEEAASGLIHRLISQVTREQGTLGSGSWVTSFKTDLSTEAIAKAKTKVGVVEREIKDRIFDDLKAQGITIQELHIRNAETGEIEIKWSKDDDEDHSGQVLPPQMSRSSRKPEDLSRVGLSPVTKLIGVVGLAAALVAAGLAVYPGVKPSGKAIARNAQVLVEPKPAPAPEPVQVATPTTRHEVCAILAKPAAGGRIAYVPNCGPEGKKSKLTFPPELQKPGQDSLTAVVEVTKGGVTVACEAQVPKGVTLQAGETRKPVGNIDADCPIVKSAE